MSNMEWTDDDVRRLEKLWMQTDPVLSTAAIARMMKLTKNAVVGKAHRIGLPKRGSPILPAGSGAAGNAYRPKPLGKRHATLPDLPSLRAPPIPRTQNGETRSVMRKSAVPVGPIAAARSADYQPRVWPKRRFDGSGCMFPIGDPRKPDFHFCDADLGGADYCEHHANIAYIESPERRRRLTARLAQAADQAGENTDAEAA